MKKMFCQNMYFVYIWDPEIVNVKDFVKANFTVCRLPFLAIGTSHEEKEWQINLSALFAECHQIKRNFFCLI